MNEFLSLKESKDLLRLEKVIHQGKLQFVMVGDALTEIRDRKLYRKDYTTFEDYCQKKWGWSAQRGRQLIEAASVVRGLSKESAKAIPNAATAQALSKVPKEKRESVVKRAASKGVIDITANVMREEAAKEEDIWDQKDALGLQIPKGIMQYWDRIDEVNDMLTTISRIKSFLTQAEKDKDALFHEVNFNAAIADLSNLYSNVSCAKPYAVCTSCQGHVSNKSCQLCGGKGFISKFRWDRAVPEEVKQIRLKGIKP